MDWLKFDVFLRLYEFAESSKYSYENLYNKHIRYLAQDNIFRVAISIDTNDIESLDNFVPWSKLYSLMPNAALTCRVSGGIFFEGTLHEFSEKYIEFRNLISKWEKKLPREIVGYEGWNEYNNVLPACPRCKKVSLVLDSNKDGYIRLNCTTCNLAIQYELITVARYPIIL